MKVAGRNITASVLAQKLSYARCRLGLYHDALKQWLTALRQIGLGLITLFPLALPALVFIPFLSLGILADPDTETSLYLNVLWGYSLLLVCWIWLQREGLLARTHHFWLASLPVSERLRRVTDLMLLVYAGNIFLLGPLVVLASILIEQPQKPGFNGDFASYWSLMENAVPLLGVIVLSWYYSMSTLYSGATGKRGWKSQERKSIPWLSLLVLPVCGFPLLSALAVNLSKIQWLAIWMSCIVVERWLLLPGWTISRWFTGYWRLLVEADIENPIGDVLRFVALLLVLVLARVTLAEVNDDVVPYIASFVSGVAAIIQGSAMFNAEATRKQHQFYLSSLPLSMQSVRQTSLLYVSLKSVPGILLLLSLNVFAGFQWLLYVAFYLSTLMGILFTSRWFMAWPFATGLILFFTMKLLDG